MSSSFVPFSGNTTEPLVPLMVQRYGWTPRVCRSRIAVLRQTVLKGKRDGMTQPSKEWMVTGYAWETIQGYLDGFDPERWGTFRAYLVEQFDVEIQPPELSDVMEELRAAREMQVSMLKRMEQLTTMLERVVERQDRFEELLQHMPDEFDAALDERRVEGDERGESVRDVIEDMREGLKMIGRTVTGELTSI